MIDLLPDAEQERLLEPLVALLDAEAPLERFRHRRQPDPASEHAVLAKLAALGWLGIALPEEIGGVGLSIAEESMLFLEAGRRLLSPALLGQVIGAHLAHGAGERQLAADLVAGSCIVGLASGDVAAPHLLDRPRSGVVVLIRPAEMAVIATTDLEPAKMIRGIDDHVAVERGTLGTRRFVSATGSEAARQFEHAMILLAAMMTGLAEAARDMSVAYAKLRQQFGQPIGAFQAIKHDCADMAVRAEAARSLVTLAALSLQEARPDAWLQSASASLIAIDAAIGNAGRTIQIHGGIGFTAECDAQLLIKRAHLLAAIGGGVRQRRRDVLAAAEALAE